MTVDPPAPPGLPRRFAPRTVQGQELPAMLRDAAALLGTAPARLAGLFLLIYVPILLLDLWPYAGAPLHFAIAAIAYCGFYAALGALRAGRSASVRDLLVPWSLPPEKILLLAASGLLPLIAALLAWWVDLGWGAVDSFLSIDIPESGFSLRQEFEFAVVLYLVDAPFRFLQPLCVLHRWSASRSLAASLMAFAANWQWALGLALLNVGLAAAFNGIDGRNTAQLLLVLGADVAIEMALCAFTLVLLERSLN